MIAGIAEKRYDYTKFYERLNEFFKPGVHEDPANRAKVDELLRSRTATSGDGQISFEEYVGRMMNAGSTTGSSTISSAGSSSPASMRIPPTSFSHLHVYR